MENENTNYVIYLIELSQSGRKNAYFDLCGINLRNVFTTAYRLIPDIERAQKITLQTFLVAWENIASFDTKKSFAIWLKGITVKFAIRDLSKYGHISNKITDKTFFAYDHEKIENLIVTLPNEDRIIFVLHDLEGYTYEEIKSFLEDQSPDEIKSKLLAIREQLMTKMKL